MKTIHSIVKSIGGMAIIAIFPLLIWLIWTIDTPEYPTKFIATDFVIIILLLILDKVITDKLKNS